MTILLVGITSISKAQSFDQGISIVKAGYGFPSLIGSVFNAYEQNSGYKASAFGPAYLKYEYGVSEKVGLGVNIAYGKNEISYTDANNYKESVTRTTYSVLARLNFHFANSKKFDPYFGPGVGFRSAEWKFKSTDPSGFDNQTIPNLFPFGLEFTIGANYYLTDNIGLYAEAGIAKSPVQFGLAFKF